MDEYTLGKELLTDSVEVPDGGLPIDVPFTIKYDPVSSPCRRVLVTKISCSKDWPG